MANALMAEVESPPDTEFLKLNRLEPPVRQFFYQRISEQGEVNELGEPRVYPPFCCQEQEAADLDTRKFKQLGVSDGKTYYQYIKDHIKPRTSIPTLDAQRVMREAFEAELTVARGRFVKPVAKRFFYGGASTGVQHPEELMARFQK